MQVKKEVLVEVVHFSRFLLGAAHLLGRFERQLPGHLGSHWAVRNLEEGS